MKELLKNLKLMGLTGYEAKCYLVLLGANQLPATEIAKLSGVPRTRTYEVLENLLRKDLCVSIPGPVVKYMASDPTILKSYHGGELLKIKNKINEHKNEIERYENEMAKAEESRNDAVDVLFDIYKKGKATTRSVTYKYIEIIRNPPLLNEKISDLIKNAKTEILGLTKPKPINRIRYEESELSAIDKGVICKNIYEIPDDIERLELLIKEVDYSQKIGEVIKVVEHLPMDVMIFDGEKVMFSAKDPMPHIDTYTCMIADHKILAEYFAIAYQVIWDNAKDPDILPEILNERKRKATQKD